MKGATGYLCTHDGYWVTTYGEVLCWACGNAITVRVGKKCLCAKPVKLPVRYRP